MSERIICPRCDHEVPAEEKCAVCGWLLESGFIIGITEEIYQKRLEEARREWHNQTNQNLERLRQMLDIMDFIIEWGTGKWSELLDRLTRAGFTHLDESQTRRLLEERVGRWEQSLQRDEVQRDMAGDKYGKDGAPMVLIPAGEFLMGSKDGDKDEKPVHKVYLDAFYIDKYLVTNAQYKRFVQATGHREPIGYGYVNGKWQDGFKPWSDSNFNGDNHPVVCVSWDDALAYAKWAGKRLPTEAEWEKAARGGLVGKRYPWGDELTHDYANYSGTGGRDKWEYTSPVGSFPPNGYGLYDMSGNVLEWCADRYDGDYYKKSPDRNPKGPDSGQYRVLRGGSWNYYDASYLRAANRFNYVSISSFNYGGFRCALQD